MSIGCDGNDEEGLVFRQKLGCTESERFEVSRWKGLEQHVGATDEGAQLSALTGIFQIEHDAAFSHAPRVAMCVWGRGVLLGCVWCGDWWCR